MEMVRITRLTLVTFAAALAACGGPAARAPAATTPPVAAAPAPADSVESPGDVDAPPAEVDEPPPPEPEEPPPEPVTMTFEPDPPKVELLARGKGKRALLRYQAAVGDPADCTIVMDMTAAAAVTVPLPTTTMSWTGKVTAVGKGTFTTSALVDVLDIAAGTDAVTQGAGDAMRAKLGPMLNGTIESTMTDRGIPQKTSFTSLGPLDPETALGMQSGAGGGMIMPEQPVGVGARWRVTRVDDRGVVVTTTVATFELVGRKGDAAMIHGSVEAVGTSALAPAATSHGTSETTFRGDLCSASTTTITTEIPAASMTIHMVMETRPRVR